MDEGNREAILFCKKCELLSLIEKADKLMKDLDVTYEEVKGWQEE